MSGTKYVLDTNALIAFLQGNPASAYLKKSAEINISVISVIEFLSFRDITDTDRILFFGFLKECRVIDIRADDEELLNTITSLRKSINIKLPDAVIAATDIIHKSALITNDNKFSKITSLQVLSY